jgi:two-component system, chemotaxis family, sensor kinase CheA
VIDDSALLTTFHEETAEHLATVENGLVELERDPTNHDAMDRVFRAAHSIKGASATMGLHSMARLTHALEGVLERLRAASLVLDAETAKLLLDSVDAMRDLLAADGGEESASTEPPVLLRLESLAGVAPMHEARPHAGAGDRSRRIELSFAPAPGFFSTGLDPVRLIDEVCALAERAVVKLDEEQVPPLDELDPERCYLRWRVALDTDKSLQALREVFEFAQGSFALELHEAGSDALRTSHDARPTAGVTIRVATEKLDRLVDLVGELLIAQTMLVDAIQSPTTEGKRRLEDTVAMLERNTRDLQEGVLSIRMVPLSMVFDRLPRVVRDVATTLGKKVRLVVEGEATEIDRAMVEQIVDPLTHLVRNAVDHGIEDAEGRRALGKAEEGTLRVKALHRGGHVEIEVSDDGGGLATEAIRRKAASLGLLDKGDVASDAALHDLLFHPGFSTSSEVTDISGRGVGLDVVKRNVESMKGTISVATEAGLGTRFTLRVPLTLAMLDGLALRVGSQTFIVPLASAVESFRPAGGQVKTLLGKPDFVDVRGATLPILRLHEELAVPDGVTEPGRGLLCVLESGQTRIAALVDDVVGQIQVVVKSLDFGRRSEVLVGAALLGDGRIAMILDVPALARRVSSRGLGADRPRRPALVEAAWQP